MSSKRLLLLLVVFCSACGASSSVSQPRVSPASASTTAVTSEVAATTGATSSASKSSPTPIPRISDTKELLLATTTSTQDSGLLDDLIPRFEQQSGYTVKVIAVGSGAAIQLGQRGDVDVVLAHAPENERAFVESGAGVDRQLVMYNDFIIVGPADDPAGIKGQRDALAALQTIAAKGSPFISRGDNSGTQQLELKLWKATNLTPQGQSWYVESGTGMGQTLRIADQRDAYTISDRATYLANKNKLMLQLLVQGDARLLNIYHVIRVSKEKFPAVNAMGASAFSVFLLLPETQAFISTFGRDKFGEPLFTACSSNSCKLANPD